MCDRDTQKDVEEYLRRHPEMSRRDFTKLATGAGLAMMMPPMANAQSVSERDVEIRTPDGVADCYFVYPSAGAHAAVLVWPAGRGANAWLVRGMRFSPLIHSIGTLTHRWSASAQVSDNRKLEKLSFLWPETKTLIRTFQTQELL